MARRTRGRNRGVEVLLDAAIPALRWMVRHYVGAPSETGTGLMKLRKRLSAMFLPATLTAALAGSAAAPAWAAGGKPFDNAAGSVDPRGAPAEGPVWDLSEPFWLFFVQERLLAPETPFDEAIPRAAFAHVRPAGEKGRLFFILAGIAYLGLYHYEAGSFELEGSLFTMLFPVGSPIYRNGRQLLAEGYEETWTDASLRARKTWGQGNAGWARLGVEYQVAARQYHATDDTGPSFVPPDDTSVQEVNLVFELDRRSRGRVGDYARGSCLELGAAYEVRGSWNVWGAGGTEYADPDAERATTVFGSLEFHATFGERVPVALHGKVRGAQGFNLDRLTYIRLGGGGFGRQFDRVGAGSTGAANDGELFRMDGVPGHFGGEFLTDRYAQVNLEVDVPTGGFSALHVSAAWARFREMLEPGGPWKDILGFGLGHTRIFSFESALRVDVGYSPRPDGALQDSGDVTLTYIKKF
jgi:hypothetical protein